MTEVEVFVGLDLFEANEKASTGDEGAVSDDVVGSKFHNGCFQGGGGFFPRAAARE